MKLSIQGPPALVEYPLTWGDVCRAFPGTPYYVNCGSMREIPHMLVSVRGQYHLVALDTGNYFAESSDHYDGYHYREAKLITPPVFAP